MCPAFLDLELDGAASRFDPGFTGLAHGVGLETGSNLTVELFDCDAECRRCKTRGPVRADPSVNPVISQRCLNGVATTCATDDDCKPPVTAADIGPCRFIFPPIQSRTINLPTCSLAYFDPVAFGDGSPVQGVADMVTGEADNSILSMNIQTAINVSCVDCIDDITPNDGIADGTCTGTTTKCDINGIGTVIPSSTSYDCPPPPNGRTIKLATNGTASAPVQWVLDGTRPKCNGSTTEPCFCGVCSDGTPCIANRDCADNVCTGNAGNNACSGAGSVCMWNETTQTGTCSVETDRPCFPDGTIGQTLIANGFAEAKDGFFNVQLANLVCLPSFQDGALDFIGGFPGPFLFQATFHVTARGAL